MPSPPLAPGSPSFQRHSQSNIDTQSATLYQHLQRLHLHQQIQQTNSQQLHRRSPPTCLPAQRTDSPPQSFNQLFQNFAQPHQRSSPPPNLANFQNLQMIREDSQDLVEQSPNDEGMETTMQVQDTSTLHGSQEIKRRQYAGKPQISITDAHGHVTDVTSDGDPDMEDSDSQTDSSTPSGSFHGTFHDSAGSPQQSCSHTPSPTSPHHVGGTNFNSLLYGNYINTNLTNVPSPPHITDIHKTVPNSYDVPFSNCHWTNPQLAYLTRLQQINPAQFRFQQVFNGSQDRFNLQQAVVQNLGLEITRNNFSYLQHNEQQTGNAAMDLSRNRSAGNGNNYSNLSPSFSSDLHKTSSNINLTSTRTVDDILHELKRILEDRQQKEKVYQCSEHLFRVENSDVQMELEVCEGSMHNGLQVRRISGDKGHYRQLCQELLSGINL